MTYDDMILSETLFTHLLEVQEIASQRLELMMKQLLEQNPAPDKKNNQMDWVKHMNTLKVQAEEIVLSELVYC
ncbi:TnpV protein [Holdemania filiformis]|uniref:TnpV protein n=1 Tax=Holdemania filiformis TaxID=61171 RepID=UPI0024322931|nr:TnpV protein [Holdemania filiformis]